MFGSDDEAGGGGKRRREPVGEEDEFYAAAKQVCARSLVADNGWPGHLHALCCSLFMPGPLEPGR